MSKRIDTFLIICLILSSSFLMGQSDGLVKGRVTDLNTGDGLPFATITCSNDGSMGVTADIDGYYQWPIEKECDKLTVEYLGYESQSITITGDKSVSYNVELSEGGIVVEEVEIIADRERYDKSNPAVDLIKKVIERRSYNKPGAQNFLQFNQYTSKSLALNNVTQESFDSGIFKQLDFLEQYIDSLDTDTNVLSIYLKEKVTNYIYENGNQTSSKISNEQKTELDLRFFDQNVEQILDHLIQEVDVYADNLFLLTKNFQNPISSGGLNMYRYYILDTIPNPRDTIIHLWTTPKNKKDIGFTGDIFIHKDDHAIKSVNYKLDSRAKLNFASDLKFQQKFKKIQNQYVQEQSTFQALFTFLDIGNGVLGRSRVVNTDYTFSKVELSDRTLELISPSLSDPLNGDKDYWIKYRTMTEGNEAQVYEMIDSLNSNAKFSFIKKLSEALVTGYIDLGKYQVGPFGATYSFNPIEGSRLQMGGRTTTELSKKMHIYGYSAYGFRDQRFKYRLGALYSFNENFDRNPVHYLNFVFGDDQYALGMELRNAYDRNLLTSFTRGVNRLFVRSKYYTLTYDKEFDSNFRFRSSASFSEQSGRGDLSFDSMNGIDVPIVDQTIGLSTLSTHLRWAPQEKYIQVREKRTPIHSKYPILELEIEQAIPNIISSDVQYTKVEMLLFKRMYLSRLGHSDILFEGGKYWGSGIPYNMLFIPTGNQTYFYKHRSYNMMNFFEFVTDSYFSINYRHYFNGFIMNRLPLINKLDLRTIVTMKALWGSLSDDNNPTLNEETIQFPSSLVDGDFTLGTKPYLEGSVGLANIFKVLRIDLLKRFTYTETSSVPKLFGKEGLAIRLKFEASF